MFEDSELRVPCDRLSAAGHVAIVVGAVQSEKLHGRLRKQKVITQLAVENASADDFDAVVIPGGYSPDRLRTNPRMVELVRDFIRAGKPVAAIGHAVALLVEADVVDGRTVTSWPSIVADLRNAGARWIDRDVVVDGTLITARSPEDLSAFCDVLLHQLARGVAAPAEMLH
ncbi:MAG: type 1 glutamine amidotransferase [Deltaproteobacteria bacterium]|nr:type 1 glutamine amidotransferase [Deltaproteobacteria bacterium]